MFNYLTESLWPAVSNAIDLGAALARWRKFWAVDADFSGVVTITRVPVAGSDATNKTYVDAAAANPTVEEVDGAPSYTDSDTIRFDQADGFVLTQPGAGIVRVDLAAIPFARLTTLAANHVVITDVGGVITSAVQLSAGSGGTGIDSTASTGAAIVNAGVWSVPATLPVAKGGTNLDTSASTGVPAVAAGVWSIPPQVTVARGGTAASTAAGARTNLGILGIYYGLPPTPPIR